MSAGLGDKERYDRKRENRCAVWSKGLLSVIAYDMNALAGIIIIQEHRASRFVCKKPP